MLKVVSSSGAAVNLSSPGPIGNVTPNTITGSIITAVDPVTGTAGTFVLDDNVGGSGTGVVTTFYIDQISSNATFSSTPAYPVKFANGIVSAGNITIDYLSGIRLGDSGGFNAVNIVSPATIPTAYNLTLPTTVGSNNQVLKTDGTGVLSWTNQGVQPTAPVTTTAATYTVAATDQWIIGNRAGTITLTLPTASTNTGRSLTIKTITANTMISASSNVVPLAGGAAGTAIVAATAGKFATLVSDGTNWIIMQAG